MSVECSADVAVIIIGKDARDYVVQCLESLGSAEWGAVTHELVYVDNGSSDDSVSAVAQRFPSVRLVANPANVGFCRAANQGARLTSSRYCYFLNDDTIVVGDAIARLVELMDRNPSVGTVGSRLVYPDGREQWSGRRFPSIVNAFLGRRSVLTRWFPNTRQVRDYLCVEQLQRGAPFDVDWVSAAGQNVRRETFNAV